MPSDGRRGDGDGWRGEALRVTRVPAGVNVIILKREHAHGAPQTHLAHPAHPPARQLVFNLVYHLDEQLQVFTV